MVVPGGPTQPHVKRPSKRRLDDTGVGAGWRAASRRQARTAPRGDPPTTGAQITTSTAVARAPT